MFTYSMNFFAEIRQKIVGGGVKSPLKFCRASAKLIRTLVITFVIFLTPFSSYAVALNFQHDGITKQIAMDTTKRTTPAFATQIGDKVYYANMVSAPATHAAGNIYVSYGGDIYELHDNKVIESKFFITTTTNTNSFTFDMSAMGKFTVDWGDGVVDEIVRTDTTKKTYSHTYSTAGEYQIGFGGLATGYSKVDEITTISFNKNLNVAYINGSLGAIFPTINGTETGAKNGGQPRFTETFAGCKNLKGNIPPNLFAGVYGAPTNRMFQSLFNSCSGLTGELPPNLFSGISGPPAEWMYSWAFEGCSNLTGTIPDNFFGNISGPAALEMYSGVFYYCSKLNGTIPVGLFGNVYGAPQHAMFAYTFTGCSKLSGPTARMPDGTRLYDVMYNDKTWLSMDNYGVYGDSQPMYFYTTYSGTRINDN